MLTRLDHLVILVRDLDRAAGDYEDLGFAVTPGGTHADGLTRNALVPFRDGTYLELISFLNPDDARDNVWGWRGFLPRGGLVDYCAASDDLRGDVNRLRGLGFDVDGPTEGGRRLPDGEEVRWRSASVGQAGRTLPLLIEDVTPRGRRVPAGPAAEHPNGASGIRRLGVSARDARETSKNLAAPTGSAPGSSRLGSVTRRGDGEGQGPALAELSADAPDNPADPDARLSHGFRFVLSSGAGS